jgi:hypothetical protein
MWKPWISYKASMGRVHHVDYFFSKSIWGYVTETSRLLKHFFPFISNFRRVVNVVWFLLGNIKFRRRGITQKKAYNFFPCCTISSFLPLYKYFVVDALMKFSYLDFHPLLSQSISSLQNTDENDIHHLLSIQIAPSNHWTQGNSQKYSYKWLLRWREQL